jgi:hypothetical protein
MPDRADEAVLMLDYRHHRDEFNRNSSTDRRREERRSRERRGTERRQHTRRRDVPASEDSFPAGQNRRSGDRRTVARRSGDRRETDRRMEERRRDPARLKRLPRGAGFLTEEEREFLESVMQSSLQE